LRRARAGRTTVVIATSPLLLSHTDVVAHLGAGRVVATGSHTDVLVRDPGYRALVSRDGVDAASPVSDRSDLGDAPLAVSDGDLDDDLGAAAGAPR